MYRWRMHVYAYQSKNHIIIVHYTFYKRSVRLTTSQTTIRSFGEGAQFDDDITVLDVRSGRIGSRTSCHIV